MPAAQRLVAALVVLAFPLLEIALLIAAGRRIGVWPVLLAVLATAVLGTWIARRQGLAAFRRVSASVAAGEQPHGALADGALLLLAGALLILPGFMTDALGLVLLISPLRKWIGARMFKSAVVFGDFAEGPEPAPRRASRDGEPARRSGGAPMVIEGEFERLGERSVDPAAAPRRGVDRPEQP